MRHPKTGRHGDLPLHVLFTLLLIPSLVFARPNQAIKAFNEGVKQFNAKQFNAAIPNFDDAVSSDPEFAEAFFARGACKYYLKSIESATMDFNDALRLKPDYLEARALRGAVAYEADHWDAALEDFSYVLKKNPEDAQSLLGRAVILLKREDFAGAERDFKGFLKVRPDDPLAPKVRELVASLKHHESPSAQGQGAGEERPSSENPSHPAPTGRRKVTRAPSMSAADIQRLADSLMGHPLTDAYNRKVLHGENAQAVGDIHSVPGMGGNKSSDSDVQIIDPR